MMKDQELKRNGSGYIDEPCYKAVTAPPRPGEIWTHAKSGAQMLVLANVNGICPTLKLNDNGGEGTVPVMSRTPMFVKPSMLAYCFENTLTQFVKSVKGNEMKAVRKGVIKALGLFDEITQDNPMQEEYKALQGEVDSLKAQLEEAKVPKTESDEMKVMEREYVECITNLEQEITRLTIYKDMYMDIIGKLVSAKVGAVNE